MRAKQEQLHDAQETGHQADDRTSDVVILHEQHHTIEATCEPRSDEPCERRPRPRPAAIGVLGEEPISRDVIRPQNERKPTRPARSLAAATGYAQQPGRSRNPPLGDCF